jgi:CBS domain containing-hemolysin-like protein
VFGELGRAPEVGDEVRTDGLCLTVVEIDGTRIMKIEVEFGADDTPDPVASPELR